jgi:lipoate-protein ligase A
MPGPRAPPDPEVDPSVTVAANVAAEEELARRAVPSIRVAVFRDFALSIGVGVPAGAAFLERARSQGIPVVQRLGGGTGVLHAPGDLAWSIVLPRSHPAVGRDYVRAYGRFGAGVVVALRDEGVPSAWGAPLGDDAGCCLLGPRGQVLRVADRVLGGAAQKLTSRALLHHGIVPLTIDRPALASLFGLERPVVERLTSLRDQGVTTGPADLATRLAARLRASDALRP